MDETARPGVLPKTLRLRVHDTEDVVPRMFRVEKGPVTLGRAPYHSIVLSDPRISLDHAQIVERDGAWWLQDLRSANGIFVAGARVTEVALDHDLDIIVGPIRVEIHVETEPHEGTLEIDTRFREEPLPKRWAWRSHAASIVLLLGLSVLAYWIRSLRHDFLSEAMLPFLILVGMMYGASGLVSLFSKVHSKRYQFSRFVPLAAFLFGSMTFFTILEDNLYFNLGHRSWGLALEFIWKVGTVIVTLWGGFRVILSQVSPRVVLGWVSVVVLALYGLLGLGQHFMDRDTDGFNNYGSIGVPTFLADLKVKGTTAWETSLDRLRGHVDEARAKVIEDGDFGDAEFEDATPEGDSEDAAQ